MAAGDLTTLASVEALLSLPSGNSDEAVLSQLISAASAFAVTYCGTPFLSQGYTETRDGKGTRVMPLRNAPITAVSSLTIGTESVPPGAPEQTPGYFFDEFRLMLYGYRFWRGLQNVTVAYTAGYAAIPLDLEQAVNELVMLRFKERKHFDQRSEGGVAGQTTTFFVGDLKPSTKTVLDKYKRVVAAA